MTLVAIHNGDQYKPVSPRYLGTPSPWTLVQTAEQGGYLRAYIRFNCISQFVWFSRSIYYTFARRAICVMSAPRKDSAPCFRYGHHANQGTCHIRPSWEEPLVTPEPHEGTNSGEVTLITGPKLILPIIIRGETNSNMVS